MISSYEIKLDISFVIFMLSFDVTNILKRTFCFFFFYFGKIPTEAFKTKFLTVTKYVFSFIIFKKSTIE